MAGDGSPQPILGLVVLCCLLSAAVGAMFTSAFWTVEADQRAEEAIAQVCPTTTTLPPVATTTAPPQTTQPEVARPEADRSVPNNPPTTNPQPISPPLVVPPTTAPPPTTEPPGSRDNPIGGESAPTTEPLIGG